LGMMPASAWSGIYDANGGYLVVKKDGTLSFKLNFQIRLK